MSHVIYQIMAVGFTKWQNTKQMTKYQTRILAIKMRSTSSKRGKIYNEYRNFDNLTLLENLFRNWTMPKTNYKNRLFSQRHKDWRWDITFRRHYHWCWDVIPGVADFTKYFALISVQFTNISYLQASFALKGSLVENSRC